MKLKFVSEDGKNAIEKNKKAILNEVVNGDKTLEEVLDMDVIKVSGIEYVPFEMDMSRPEKEKTDLENVKRVYGSLKHLSDSQAADERIWIAFTLSECIEYMRYRWPAKSENDISNNYTFGQSRQRSHFRNGMAWLWWLGRISYDDTRENPYELTEFLLRDRDFIGALTRNVFNNDRIRKTVLNVLLDARNAGVKVDRELVRETGKYVNLLAGVYVLETLESEELHEKLKTKIKF